MDRERLVEDFYVGDVNGGGGGIVLDLGREEAGDAFVLAEIEVAFAILGGAARIEDVAGESVA